MINPTYFLEDLKNFHIHTHTYTFLMLIVQFLAFLHVNLLANFIMLKVTFGSWVPTDTTVLILTGTNLFLPHNRCGPKNMTSDRNQLQDYLIPLFFKAFSAGCFLFPLQPSSIHRGKVKWIFWVYGKKAKQKKANRHWNKITKTNLKFSSLITQGNKRIHILQMNRPWR